MKFECTHECKWNKDKKCSRRYIAVVVDTTEDKISCMCLSSGKRNWKRKEEAFEALEGFVGNPCGYCGTNLVKHYDAIICPKCERERFV